MSDQAPISAGFYSLIRMLLGSYLLVHFVELMPYGSELFSASGVLSAQNSPLLGIIPNPLHHYDSSLVVMILLMLGALSGLFIAIGKYDRLCAFLTVILLGWLYARNPLIANPSMPVVGWMLLAHCFIPTNAYGSWAARGQADKWTQWFFPKQIWFAAWLMLAVAYSYSGYTKLLSPSWVDGSAISLVLENPLARDHFLREFLLSLPAIVLKCLTWGLLVLEIIFLPLCLHASTRKWAWFLMLLVQVGFLVFLNFADLTFPMFLIHALTFDRRWLEKSSLDEKFVLFYDGSCAFCSGLVRFCLNEDYRKNIEFSPLQGQLFKDLSSTPPEDDSIALLSESGELIYKSDAALKCMKALGGFWALMAIILSIFPLIIRDKVYDIIGKIRFKLAGKVELDSCHLLPALYSQRILP